MKSNPQFIIGVSGSGKTFSINQSVLKLNQKGKRTIVLVSEFSAEHKPTCKVTNGEYEDLSLSKQKINIMDFVKQEEGKTNVNILYAFFEAVAKRELSKIEKEDITSAASDTFGMKRNSSPMLRDFLEAMKEYPALKEVSDKLELMLEDSRCQFFNGDTNVTFPSLHTVLSIDNFPIKYRIAALLTVINYLALWMKNNPDTHIFLDSGIMSMGSQNTLCFIAQKIKEISEYSKISVTMASLENFHGVWDGIFGQEWELQLMAVLPPEKEMIEKLFNIKISPETFALVNKFERGEYVNILSND